MLPMGVMPAFCSPRPPPPPPAPMPPVLPPPWASARVVTAAAVKSTFRNMESPLLSPCAGRARMGRLRTSALSRSMLYLTTIRQGMGDYEREERAVLRRQSGGAAAAHPARVGGPGVYRSAIPFGAELWRGVPGPLAVGPARGGRVRRHSEGAEVGRVGRGRKRVV